MRKICICTNWYKSIQLYFHQKLLRSRLFEVKVSNKFVQICIKSNPTGCTSAHSIALDNQPPTSRSVFQKVDGNILIWRSSSQLVVSRCLKTKRQQRSWENTHPLKQVAKDDCLCILSLFSSHLASSQQKFPERSVCACGSSCDVLSDRSSLKDK